MKQSSSRVSYYVPLIAGVVIFVAMTAVLAEVSEDIINHEPLTVVDVQLSNWLHIHGSAGLTTVMRVLTFFGSTVVVCIAAIGFGGFLLRKRRFGWVVVLGAAVLGGALLNRLLKYFFHRPRPYFDDPILTLTSYSFPSGHTMMATVLYGAIAACLVAMTSDWRKRLVIVGGAVVLILIVGFSRIYLGAHYLSDVLGAMAEGLAWLSLCLTLVSAVLRRTKNA